jgi:hypothetical protein
MTQSPTARLKWNLYQRTRAAAKRKESPELALFLNARFRAARSFRPFHLTIKDIVIPLRCSLDGTILIKGAYVTNPAAPVLTLIDYDGEWTPTNTHVISKAAFLRTRPKQQRLR